VTRESLWQDHTTIQGTASGTGASEAAPPPEDSLLYVGDAQYAVITVNISYRSAHGGTFPAIAIQVAPSRGGTWTTVGSAVTALGEATIKLAREPASGSSALRMDGAWLRWCVLQPASADGQAYRITFLVTAVLI